MFHSVLQTKAWGRFKTRLGWQARQHGQLLVLERSLPFGRRLRYAPELLWQNESLDLLNELKKSPPEPGELFTRLEFLVFWSQANAGELVRRGLVKSFEEVQPEYRQWVNLMASEEAILKQMKPKGRYNVNLAKRHHLKVRCGTEPSLVEDFYHLYALTAARNRFAPRSLRYFQTLVEELKKDDLVEVMVVSTKAQPLSAGIFTYHDQLASYLYGASSNSERQLMAPYLLHWEAIRRAKKRDCQVYDLLAVAPPDVADHPYTQLTRFKTQFGGETVRLLGSWDLVRSPFWYSIYRFVERRRRPTAN